MADEPIPDDLREFILGHIDSIAQLEALLLLRRNPGTTWNASSVAQRLYVSEGEATDSRHLIPITNMIHGKPRRIREFSDAFKFRRDRS
jgi:hypothetical protein